MFGNGIISSPLSEARSQAEPVVSLGGTMYSSLLLQDCSDNDMNADISFFMPETSFLLLFFVQSNYNFLPALSARKTLVC